MHACIPIPMPAFQIPHLHSDIHAYVLTREASITEATHTSNFKTPCPLVDSYVALLGPREPLLLNDIKFRKCTNSQ